jgi:alcohol dehydrogenase class IV
MRFEFVTAARIIFGPGVAREAGALAAPLGQRALVVGSVPPGADVAAAPAAQTLLASLSGSGLSYVTFAVGGEPGVELVRLGVEFARAEKVDMVIGLGGGSAIDTGKAIAALLTNGGDPLDYLEVIGAGQSLRVPAAPYIAIPTTAGTGAEVTRNAVLASPAHRVKASLRSPFLLPRIALVDPELTYSLPQSITASTGMDALTQLVEPYVSPRANPLTDALCRDGITRAARSLRRVYEHGDDAAGREDMALASLLGGLALANAGLGAVHGFAAPIGGMFPAPHGAVCARLLPLVAAANVTALRARQPNSPSLHRYREVAAMLTGNPAATAADGVAWLAELCVALHIPPLSAYGMTLADIPVLVEQASIASSMRANPVVLSADELAAILRAAIAEDTGSQEAR